MLRFLDSSGFLIYFLILKMADCRMSVYNESFLDSFHLGTSKVEHLQYGTVPVGTVRVPAHFFKETATYRTVPVGDYHWTTVPVPYLLRKWQ